MLFGKRIRLRAIERSDIDTFVRWFNDPDLRHFLEAYEPMSRAQEERWFESHLNKESVIFGIEAPGLGADAEGANGWVLIGNVGLERVDWKNRSAVLGIAMGEKAYWGKGFGTDAVRTILRYCFHELNLHRVQLVVYDFNTRAMRCYEKAGFRREGTRRQAHFHRGTYHDIHMMGILRDEFVDDLAEACPGEERAA
jgi:RimJ/RimL family protein N-acetyltransferase